MSRLPGVPLADIPAAPVLVVMAVGVVVAAAGHARHSTRQVAVGLAFLFLATALMMVLGFNAYQGDEVDPRPVKPPSEPGF
jgi:uncharacterized membrane protein YfcA